MIPDIGTTFLSPIEHKRGITYHHYSKGEVEELRVRNVLRIIDAHESTAIRTDELDGHRVCGIEVTFMPPMILEMPKEVPYTYETDY